MPACGMPPIPFQSLSGEWSCTVKYAKLEFKSVSPVMKKMLKKSVEHVFQLNSDLAFYKDFK